MRWLTTPVGRVPQISTNLTSKDRRGAWKVRWGMGRMEFLVPPGLYALGSPTPEAPVVVTANYKLSYDLVRAALAGRSLWLLVLETYGINVWCAAGKGTFGTEEIVNRVQATGLAAIVSHRRLLLPILGAPGVAAHEVARLTGFSCHYAAIRAADLPEYLDNGMLTTPAMRELTFTTRERLVLLPVELVSALKPSSMVALGLFLLFAWLGGITAGLGALLAYGGAMLTGIVAAPLCLPWLPGRSFAVKGACAGLGWALLFLQITRAHNLPAATLAAAILILPAVSSFHTLNFTGCTPYTSRSGVKKEMRHALPLMACAIAAGVVLAVMGGGR